MSEESQKAPRPYIGVAMNAALIQFSYEEIMDYMKQWDPNVPEPTEPDTSLRSPSPSFEPLAGEKVEKGPGWREQKCANCVFSREQHLPHNRYACPTIREKQAAPAPGDITSLVDAHRQASLQSTMNSIGGGSLEPAHTIERNARQALLDAFSALQRERDDARRHYADGFRLYQECGHKIRDLEGQLSRLREAGK